MASFFWRSEYRLQAGAVHVSQTGASIPIDGAFLRDGLAWLTYYVPLRLWSGVRRRIRPGPKLWFAPKRPPPWYLVWNACAYIGARAARSPDEADAGFYFEDATWGEGAQTGSVPCINGECRDVSKSHVAEIFERVFGYPLAIDPTRTNGFAVEKGETNGVHDGRLIACPTPPTQGRVYQRLIETGDDAYVEDLRTPCVGGAPVVVFIKRRLRSARFSNTNASVSLADPDDIFSQEEREKIGAFAREMKLDWGGLDILRERSSGRLYIVDANKTDMPPLALPFADKMRASAKLGAALESFLRQLKRSAAS